MKWNHFLQELKRRNVIKSSLAYIVASWIIIQVNSIILPAFNISTSNLKYVIIFHCVGFPIWVLFSWYYELTPDGIKKTEHINPEESITKKTGNQLSNLILFGLGLVILLLAYNIFKISSSESAKRSEITSSTIENNKSIAVLAFADMSPEKDQEYFSDGISEEILNLLAKIPDLKVISRTSSFSYKGKEENIQQIFDPYFSTKVKETGSGLGLYVTYGIIKAHKGHIEVTSIPDAGTRFDVFIPAFEPKELEKQPAPDKIILLVDDEIMLRDLLAELLESNGYYVVIVSTGEEALKVLTEEIRADLVIIDYNMPGMNGLECIKKIRELKFTMPIILSSGSLSVEENLNPAEIGINSILSKPYEFESMLGTIQKLI